MGGLVLRFKGGRYDHSINQELYEALIAAGAPDDAAKRAAASVLSRDNLSQVATTADLAELKGELSAIRVDLAWVKWLVTGGVGLYVIQSIMAWLR